MTRSRAAILSNLLRKLKREIRYAPIRLQADHTHDMGACAAATLRRVFGRDRPPA